MPDAVPDRGPVRFRRHRDAGDVLNATLGLIRGEFREIARSVLAIVLPAALATGVALGLLFFQVGDVMFDPEALEDDPFALFGVTYLGALLFQLLATGVTVAAVAAYVRLYRRGETGDLTAGELWEEAKGLVLPYVGFLLVVMAVMVLSIPIVAVPCLGVLAWLAFAIWLMPYLAVAVAARALEVDSLGAAWARARELVKGEWKFAFWALFVAGVVFYAVVLLASIPLYVVLAVAGMTTTADPAASFTLLGVVFAPLQVVTYAAYVVPLLAAFFVHGRLVEDLEGTGLYRDLDGLGGLEADGDPLEAPGLDSTPPAASTPPSETPRDDGGGFRGGGFRS